MILLLLFGFLGGLLVSWRLFISPLQQVRARLRRELGEARQDLHHAQATTKRLSDHIMDHFRDRHVPKDPSGEVFKNCSFIGVQRLTPPPGWEVIRASTPSPEMLRAFWNHGFRIGHRDHSDTLFIPHPEDLLK